MIQSSIDELCALGLADGDWALFGSGPLFLRGWIDHVGDFDVVARGEALEHAKRVGEPQELAGGGVIWRLGQRVTVGDFWQYGDFVVDELIDSADLIEGIPCVKLEHIITYKRIADRHRDRMHLEAIEAHR